MAKILSSTDLFNKFNTCLIVNQKSEIVMISDIDSLNNKRVFLNSTENVELKIGQILKFERFKVTRNGNIFVYGVTICEDRHIRKQKEKGDVESSTHPRCDIGSFLCHKKHQLIDAKVVPGSKTWDSVLKIETSIFNTIYGRNEEPTVDKPSVWKKHFHDRWGISLN